VAKLTGVLALTLGDPDGIGPEITAKAWEKLHDESDFAFALVCEGPAPDLSIPVIESSWETAKADFAKALPVISNDTPDLSTPTQAVHSIKLAVDATLTGQADGVVTNPISKERLYAEGFSHPGHTEYLAELTADVDAPYARGPVMMLAAGDQLRCALVSIHESLRVMLDRLTPERIESAARTLHGAMAQDFGIESPRIALSGLNPHAGEGGSLGREEIEIINPCAARLRKEGIQITDALPADTLFHEEARETYDAVLAMYHDQGLIPVKSLDFHNGVNITLGLPIIRTSPDHGTAFDIAGQGIARPDSLIAAIRMARRLADNRHG